MTDPVTGGDPVEENTGNRKLALLLAIALFVLVVAYVADELLDLGRRRGSRHDGERRAVGDRARGTGVRCVHPDQLTPLPDRHAGRLTLHGSGLELESGSPFHGETADLDPLGHRRSFQIHLLPPSRGWCPNGGNSPVHASVGAGSLDRVIERRRGSPDRENVGSKQL